MALSLRVDCDAARLKLSAWESEDTDQVRRLLALAAIYNGASRAQAVQIGGVTRRIVRDWVMRFNEGGPDSLAARKMPRKPPLLIPDSTRPWRK